MKPSIVIIDNLFKDAKSYNNFVKIAEEGRIASWQSMFCPETYTGFIVRTAAKYYDITKAKGYEAWSHNNTRPDDNGWHYDKDEYRYSVTGRLSFPICSCVFYLEVRSLKGGRLVIEDTKIVPKTKHSVEDFTGIRHSININPWNRRLEEYS